MLAQNLPPTPIDIHFQVIGIPVHVSGWFWILPLIFGSQLGHPIFILIAAIVIFVAILVHELGHAVMMRRYGIRPRIGLTAFGGFATADHGDVWNLQGFSSGGRMSPNQQIIISAAGPLAGFCLAALTIGLVFLFGGWVHFDVIYGVIPVWNIELVRGERFFGDFVNGMASSPTSRDMIYTMIHFALFVNIWWGILNLMPVYPLDGGQIAREVMVKNDPRQGLRNSLWLSVYAGVILAVVGVFVMKAFFMGMFFGIFAFQSYEMIKRIDGKGFGPGPW